MSSYIVDIIWIIVYVRKDDINVWIYDINWNNVFFFCLYLWLMLWLMLLILFLIELIMFLVLFDMLLVMFVVLLEMLFYMFLVLFIKLVLIFDRDFLIWLVNRWFRFFVVDFNEVLMLEVRDVSLLLKFLRLFIDE